MNEVAKLEEEVWKMKPIPFHQTYTAVNNGGLMLGAYEKETMIGFLYSFPGFKDGNVYLCSHMLGIHPHYRKIGLGKKMKETQRQIALDKGYKLVTWTFDPLESVNAYLNLTKLNGIGAKYLENYYGVMDDALNAGLPSDRFLIEWWIDSGHVNDRVKTKVAGGPMFFHTQLNKDGLLTAGEPLIDKINTAENSFSVPIPFDFQSIKKEDHGLATDWRLKTRQAIMSLMTSGYVAENLTKDEANNRCLYEFKKRSSLKS